MRERSRPLTPSRPSSPLASIPVDRRAFLAGAGAVVAVACTSPEKELVTRADIDSVDLTARRPPTSTAPLGEPLTTEPDAAPTTTEDAAASPSPDDLLADIPESDRVGLVLVAEATGPSVTVFDEPGGSVTHTLANPIPSGGPLVFLVDELGAEGWHRVLLPVRPNGATGWIRETEISLSRHNYRLLVELEAFRLTAFDRDEEFFEATVGVAADNTPTPGGRYYITELIQPEAPDSVYGVFAYGLSGYSEVLEEFAGGPGQLGIHGTNDPATIGTKVSNGCIRLRNEDVSLLVAEGLPLGTPVEVV